MNQDIVGWVGQGVIADRSLEHLGSSDRGIAMIRSRFLEEIAKLDGGMELKGIIRDPDLARCVPLPTPDAGPIGKRILSRAEYLADKWFAKRLQRLSLARRLSARDPRGVPPGRRRRMSRVLSSVA